MRVVLVISVLMSYAYRRPVEALPPCHLMLDSGAFTMITRGQPVTLPDLSAWYATVEAERYAALDVVYDPVASRANALEMRRRGLDVTPVVHPGTSPDEVDRLADDGFTSVALGGTRFGFLNKADAHRWIVACLDRAEVRGMPVHGFAYCPTEPRYTSTLMRFASVDVSSWTQPSMWGLFILWDGTRMRYYDADTDRAAMSAILRRWPVDTAGALTRVMHRGRAGADGRSWLWYLISGLSYLLFGQYLVSHGGPRVYLAAAIDTCFPYLGKLAEAFELMEPGA